jgi:signal transduction histidine kinase/CheY-like chemotaxis protein
VESVAKILVVDDDPANRQLLVQLLGYGGHTVLEAKGPLEGLDRVRAERPDLLIVDIQMPDMDGYEFVNQVRSEPEIRDSAIMFYTATFDPRRAQGVADTMGVPIVLTKPIDPRKLLSNVDRALQTKTSVMTTALSTKPVISPEFDQAHFRLVADKLTDKVGEARNLSERLTRLVELSLELNVEQDIPSMLETFCRAGCQLVGAGYTAIGIVAPDAVTLDHFVVRGADYVGDLPAPPLKGLLQQLSTAREPICLNSLVCEPLTLGLPRQCGTVRNLLGVPVASRKRSFGWIYFAQKDGDDGFTVDDQHIAKSLAAKLAVGYENVALYLEIRNQAEVLEARVSERTAELMRTNEKLEETRQQQLDMKDQFLAHVSHELRTPLAASDLFVKNLLEGISGQLSVQQREDLQIVLMNIGQLRRMIGDLLEATRADAGTLRVERQEVSLKGLIAETLSTFTLSADTVGLQDNTPSVLPTVYADPQRVRQVLNNLIDNAIKFTPARGTISIGARVVEPEQDFVCVEVADTGRGISSSGKQHVFERMYQERHTNEASRSGLGLGLYLCRLLVERHGGRIWVESEQGRGSTFFFTLPVSPQSRLPDTANRSNVLVQ